MQTWRRLRPWSMGSSISCAGDRHNVPPPPASWQYIRIYSPGGTCSGMLAICHPQQVDLWPFNLESDVQVTCDVDYLCTNFGLPIGLSFLHLGPVYATDVRQPDVRQHHRFRPMGRRHNNALFHSSPHINQMLLQIIHILHLCLENSFHWIMPQIL